MIMRYFSSLGPLPAVSNQIISFKPNGGFILANGREFDNGIAVIGNRYYKWLLPEGKITSKSLSVIQILRPLPDIIIIGTGKDRIPLPLELRKKFLSPIELHPSVRCVFFANQL
jgi:hypothetical protein